MILILTKFQHNWCSFIVSDQCAFILVGQHILDYYTIIQSMSKCELENTYFSAWLCLASFCKVEKSLRESDFCERQLRWVRIPLLLLRKEMDPLRKNIFTLACTWSTIQYFNKRPKWNKNFTTSLVIHGKNSYTNNWIDVKKKVHIFITSE